MPKDALKSTPMVEYKVFFNAIVISTESHADGKGIHLHVGIYTNNASRYKATKQLRRTFPEFEESQLHCRFHHGFGTICQSISKEDKNPVVWGTYQREDILHIARAAP